MGKYDLLEDFWKLCEQYFGCIDVKPILEKLLVTMFVTYTGRYLHGELPRIWKSSQLQRWNNCLAFNNRRKVYSAAALYGSVARC